MSLISRYTTGALIEPRTCGPIRNMAVDGLNNNRSSLSPDPGLTAQQFLKLKLASTEILLKWPLYCELTTSLIKYFERKFALFYVTVTTPCCFPKLHIQVPTAFVLGMSTAPLYFGPFSHFLVLIVFSFSRFS